MKRTKKKLLNVFTPNILLLWMFILYLGQGHYIAVYLRNEIKTRLNNSRRSTVLASSKNFKLCTMRSESTDRKMVRSLCCYSNPPSYTTWAAALRFLQALRQLKFLLEGEWEKRNWATYRSFYSLSEVEWNGLVF